MTGANEAAYPLLDNSGSGLCMREGGMTKREVMAIAAMQGLLATCENGNHDPKNVAHWAVRNADELIAALNKEPEQ
jgi:hypothetical protein